MELHSRLLLVLLILLTQVQPVGVAMTTSNDVVSIDLFYVVVMLTVIWVVVLVVLLALTQLVPPLPPALPPGGTHGG